MLFSVQRPLSLYIIAVKGGLAARSPTAGFGMLCEMTP